MITRNDRLDRILAARDAAPAHSAFLADIAGCLVETRRDAWIFRDGTLVQHAPCGTIDATPEAVSFGDLSIPFSSPAHEEGDPHLLSLRLDDSTWRINTVDFQDPYHALEDLGNRMAGWRAEGLDLVAHVDGGEAVPIRPDELVLGPVERDRTGIHGLAIARADLSIAFHEVGTLGLIDGEDGGVTILALTGRSLRIAPART